MKIIFLDIDGVLNHEHGYREGTIISKKHKEKGGYDCFDPESKKLLNYLISYTKAKVVVSSTWRLHGIEWLQHIWHKEDMLGEIIDITPRIYIDEISTPRGLEIDTWLRKNGYRDINFSAEKQQKFIDNSGIENYLIIDDDSDMLYNQRRHFVHVLEDPHNKKGFNDIMLQKSLEVLTKSAVELKYGNQKPSV